MERVFIGAGLMGGGLALGALQRGEGVVVWNRTRAKAEAITGARVVDSISEAVVGADLVHVALTADAAVDAVLPQIYATAPHAIVVDHSTTSVERTAARAAELSASGHRYLHAPVFMNPTLCRASEGAMLVSGSGRWFEQVESRLEVMTGRVLYLGERPEQAAAMKLVGNAMIIQTVGALADVFALADAVGVEREAAHELVTLISPANVVRGRGKRMLEGDLTPHWSLNMARKDLGLMLEAVQAPMLTALAAHMDDVIAAGKGGDDLAVLGV